MLGAGSLPDFPLRVLPGPLSPPHGETDTDAVVEAAANLARSLDAKCLLVFTRTGSSARRLRIPSEDEFWGRGIASCAICDGATPMFREQELVLVCGDLCSREEALVGGVERGVLLDGRDIISLRLAVFVGQREGDLRASL